MAEVDYTALDTLLRMLGRQGAPLPLRERCHIPDAVMYYYNVPASALPRFDALIAREVNHNVLREVPMSRSAEQLEQLSVKPNTVEDAIAYLRVARYYDEHYHTALELVVCYAAARLSDSLACKNSVVPGSAQAGGAAHGE